MMQKVAFIGLGVMGFPMAGYLAKAGYQLTVFNRTLAKADRWVQQYSGDVADTPEQAVQGADFIITCVGDDSDLEQLFLGQGNLAEAITPGALVIDHTTASAAIARRLEDQLGARQIGFMDAPVSGGQQGAEQGSLTVMCGATPQAMQRAEPLLQHYAKRVSCMGPVGSGQLTKMVNQICVAGVVQGLSEGLLFAESAGLEIPNVIRAISKGAAQSWQMENRYQTMADGEYEHGFAVDWMRKDLKLCLEEAQRQGISLPGTALIDQFYADVQSMGGGRWDTSSLLARLRRLAGMAE